MSTEKVSLTSFLEEISREAVCLVCGGRCWQSEAGCRARRQRPHGLADTDPRTLGRDLAIGAVLARTEKPWCQWGLLVTEDPPVWNVLRVPRTELPAMMRGFQDLYGPDKVTEDWLRALEEKTDQLPIFVLPDDPDTVELLFVRDGLPGERP